MPSKGKSDWPALPESWNEKVSVLEDFGAGHNLTMYVLKNKKINGIFNFGKFVVIMNLRDPNGLTKKAQ